jgi:hypothetical protein
MTLARFLGAGMFTNAVPYPDWAYWYQELIQLSGTQQKASDLFARLLTRMIGVPIQPPRAV